MAKQKTSSSASTQQSNDYNKRYTAKVYPFSNTGATTGLDVTSFVINEKRNNGWTGIVTLVVVSSSTVVTPEEVFTFVMNNDLLPGTPVSLRLESKDTSTTKRIWPSVISHIETVPRSESAFKRIKTQGAVCNIHIADPLTYFSDSPIWGVYKERSPAEILGGVLSLASGGNGAPTTRPIISDLPRISINQNVRTNIQSIPYAIAAGETLKEWIGAVFGRLGLRIETRGIFSAGSPQVELTLSDKPPVVAVSIAMATSQYTSEDGASFALRSINLRPIREQRGAVVDNPSMGSTRRIGPSGPVEMLFYGSNIDVNEARYRNRFSYERDISSAVTISGDSADPSAYPGHIVQITDPDPILGEAQWQVVNAYHSYSATGYINRIILEEKDVAWRPPIPPAWGPVIVSGIVNSNKTKKGEVVPRDRVGRIPISFAVSSDNEPDSLTLDLTLVEPMAGGRHGFIPQHREGDLCRISIINPLYAEVLGFCYRTDRAIAENISDASAGLVVRHDYEQWKGLLFRPYKQINAEESESDTEDDSAEDSAA